MAFPSAAVGGGLGLGIFMAISVGPTLFAVIRYSMNHSWHSGVAFVIGVSLSDIMFVTLANLAAPFLEALHRYETWLAYGGGTLLMLMGAFGLFKKYKPQRPSQKLTSVGSGHYFRIFGSGFLINTINPGVIINWLAAVTVIANQNSYYRLVFFVSCLGLVLGVDFLKVLLADSIRKRLTLRIVMHLNRISAGIIFAFGLIIVVITLLHVDLNPSDIKDELRGRKKAAQASLVRRHILPLPSPSSLPSSSLPLAFR